MNNQYLVIPKDKFNFPLWQVIFSSIDGSRATHHICDINYHENALPLSLSQNDSDWSDTYAYFKKSSFFKTDTIKTPHINDILSNDALYFIRFNYSIPQVILDILKGSDDISLVEFPENASINNYPAKKLMTGYQKSLQDKKFQTVDKDELRNEIIADMLARPINKWINSQLEGFNIQEDITNKINQYIDSVKAPNVVKQVKFNGKMLDGILHKQFNQVMDLIQLQEPLFIYGNAGSGKTRICIDVANALGLEYRTISVNEQSTKTDFLGYFDAHSNLVRTPFRDMYEHGGVFILDEIDAGNPNVLTVLNSALSNGVMSFPDGMISKHEKFICICTANTTGDTANIKYVGRNILDAATLDRFIRLHIDYDRTLEDAFISKKTSKIRDKLLKALEVLDSDIEDYIVSSRSVMQLDKLISIKIEPREAVKLVFNFPDHILDKIK